jgi:two-component system sensor histidine kinase YesM
LLEKQKVSKRTKIYFIDNQGNIILAQNPNEIGQEFSFEKSKIVIDSQKSGYTQLGYGGKKSIVVYTGIGTRGWKVVEIIPASDLYTTLNTYIWVSLLLALVLLVMFVPAYLLFIKNVSVPINDLSNIMSNYEKFEDIVPYKGMRVDEIYTLYEGYNSMQKKIHQQMSELKKEHEFRRQADLKVLQNQINPHFLYNTLDSINWMALEGNAKEVSSVVVRLSMLMRLSLNKGESICTLNDEIEYVRLYMELQKMCNKDSFEFNLDVLEKDKSLYIPKLIVQPIVENSIIHGLEYIRSGGEITVHTYVADDKLVIEVKDNGQGIPEDVIATILSTDCKRGSFGIKNVCERIMYLYGEGYGLSYQSTVGKGTKVTILLPAIDERQWYDKCGGE